MAAALPVSAWQPPTAPETDALRWIMRPMPAETKRPSAIFLSDRPCISAKVVKKPGMMPEAPAVGAATTLPMQAFVSFAAKARPIMWVNAWSITCTLASYTLRPAPCTIPLRLCSSWVLPYTTASFITTQARSSPSQMASSVPPFSFSS